MIRVDEIKILEYVNGQPSLAKVALNCDSLSELDTATTDDIIGFPGSCEIALGSTAVDTKLNVTVMKSNGEWDK